MLEIKPLLESTGIKVKEGCFVKPPPMPYIVFNEEEESNGSDFGNEVLTRQITIELYTETINRKAQSKITSLLKSHGIHYIIHRVWIESEKFWQTVIKFELIEKE